MGEKGSGSKSTGWPVLRPQQGFTSKNRVAALVSRGHCAGTVAFPQGDLQA